MPAADVPVVTIVGGGFSGASLAIQLARHGALPLDVTVIEPRADVGRGLAYSTDDPDHRLNGTAGTHLVDPDDPGELTRWCAAQGIALDDADAVAPGGALFVRRRDFGRFLADAFAREARRGGRVRLRHLRDEAITVTLYTRPADVLNATAWEGKVADYGSYRIIHGIWPDKVRQCMRSPCASIHWRRLSRSWSSG